jgi:hypothetical protein
MTSAAISRFLEKNIGQIFKKNLEVQKKLSYPQMCREDTTDTAFKRYDTVGNITEATVKGEGQPIKYDEFKQGYETIIHTKTVAKGVHISMEASEDDLYGVVDTGKGAQLMRAINTAKEKAVANLFNTAFTGTGADGKA